MIYKSKALKNEIEDLRSEISTHEETIERLQDKIQTIQSDHHRELMNLKGKYQSEPNVTEHKSYEDYESESESMPTLKYNLNEDGTVQSVEISMPMVKVLKEYDIILSGEYFHPEHPELGYKYVETNHKETVIDSGNTTVTFTFTYR